MKLNGFMPKTEARHPEDNKKVVDAADGACDYDFDYIYTDTDTSTDGEPKAGFKLTIARIKLVCLCYWMLLTIKIRAFIKRLFGTS